MTQLAFFADPLEAAFAEFDAANPVIWDLFCHFARELIAAGHTHYSADAIVHRIRWHTNVETRSDDERKINDHHVTFYARKWLRTHDRPGFFRLRVRRTM